MSNAYDQLFKQPPPSATVKSQIKEADEQGGDVDMTEQAVNFELNSTLKTNGSQVPNADQLEDIDVPGDEFYLKYYRSFHNHELDSNMILNEAQILDEDMIRAGSLCQLP